MKQQKDDLSLKDLILKTRAIIEFARTKWMIVLLSGVFGGVAGISYSYFKKPLYTATCSFVLEESKGSGLGQYANLASIAGIDLSGGSGIFEGDNIIELYKSRTMIAKTLLSSISVNGHTQLLIDRYTDFLGLRKKWINDEKVGNVAFKAPYDSLSRKQDSLITDIVAAIKKKVLSVEKPDKKLNIFNVGVTFGDEVFAKTFNDKLVATVNDFYIRTKTKKSSQSLFVLQKQADSVRAVLNSSLGGVASSLDASPNANPLLLSLKVPSQRKQIDVQSSSAIYAEIVKNLELTKISLRQETPLIQVIDNPVLPLTVDKPGKIKLFLIGFFLLVFSSFVYLMMKKVLNDIMNEND